jgi:hypothetical protein
MHLGCSSATLKKLQDATENLHKLVLEERMQMKMVSVAAIMYGDAVGSDSNATLLNSPSASHGVAGVRIHSQAASQGTGVANVRHTDMSMHALLLQRNSCQSKEKPTHNQPIIYIYISWSWFCA